MAQKPTIRFVVTDLDNTLYDWYSAFVPAFYAMVDVAATVLDTDRELLLNDLQAVHRQHSNSEHPFALLETATVTSRFPNRSKHEVMEYLDPAFHAFNRVRKAHLILYDGVQDSLRGLYEQGVVLVAYTDARVVNSLSRLRKLDIRRYFARLYAPAPVIPDEDSDDLQDPFVRLLPAEDRKPNPKTLTDIRTTNGFSMTETLYIGDSMVRDIFMAKRAGVQAAWARFGTQYDKALWPQLVRVTHWTSRDVEREEALRKDAEGTAPDCVLDRFPDIFRYYDFARAAKRVPT